MGYPLATPPARPPTAEGDTGFSLVEVVVAITILAVVVASAAGVLSTSVSTVARAEQRDRAAGIGAQILEHADANGCGLVTGNRIDRADTAGVGDGYSARLDRITQRCFGSLGSASNLVYDAATPTRRYVPTACAPGQFTCDFHVNFDWPRETVGGACTSAPLQPNVLVRSVVVRWTEQGVTQQRTFSTREVISPDSASFQSFGTGSAQLGSLQVAVPAGGSAQLILNPSATGLRQQRIAHTATSGSSCVFFPFLDPGSYTLQRADGSTVSATVTGAANAPSQI